VLLIFFIRYELITGLPTRPIVRVDADAVIQQMPSLFGQPNFKPDPWLNKSFF